MQQTGNLILADSLGFMAKRRGHRCAHARGPNRMRAIVPANDAPVVSRVRAIVETHQPGQERTRHQERSASVGKWFHEQG